MRAVVTGGAGFIGSHVVDALVARGDEVTVIDDLSTGRREFVNPGAQLVEHDIREPFAFDADIVFHLAAQADVGTSVEQPIFDAEVNVLGTLNVLEAARATGATVVFTSTGGAIYGEVAAPCRRGRRRCVPVSPYGMAKQAAEEYVTGWSRLHDIGHGRATSRQRVRAASVGRRSKAEWSRSSSSEWWRARETVDLRRRRADPGLRLRRGRRQRGPRRGRAC